MKAIHLRTEYLQTPIGLSIERPRFYWNCDEGKIQTAYQITASLNDELIWDSGKCMSSSTTHIQYGGPKLQSRDRVKWSVRLWNEDDQEGEWSTSWFEIGLLSESEWKAKWIRGNYTPKKHHRYPVDCFRKTFFARGNVKQARLYITAHGLYEAKLNGRLVNDEKFTPGCTDYRKRLQYQVYDVSFGLREGMNSLEVQLADGWYRGSIGCFGITNVYGRTTKVLVQLEVHYDDDSKELITSDESFEWSNDGPIRFADLKDGEIYDSRKKATYSKKAVVVNESQYPQTSNNIPVKEKETFRPILCTSANGKRILDFGQNIAGYIAFKVQGKEGQNLHLQFGEILDEVGYLSMKNIQKIKPAKEFGKIKEIMLITGKESKLKCEMVPTPKQEIDFICSGQVDSYKTTFAVFGFRYVSVEGDVAIDPSDFEAIAVYSDMTRTGHFSCSNDKVNRFFENTVWSMKGNFLDIPTDCPTRERLGWTGDGQVFFNTAAYLMDIAAFYRKWLHDFVDAQTKDGRISAVIPYAGADLLYNNTGMSVGWADAVILIPYRFWKRYGDVTLLKEFYPMMQRYAMKMIEKSGPKKNSPSKDIDSNKYVYEKGFHLGEWLEPEEFKDKDIIKAPLRTEEATAYLHYSMKHMVEIAGVLGFKADEQLFKEYADGAKSAYAELFITTKKYNTDRQAKLIRPLAFDIVTDQDRVLIQRRLKQAVENRDYRIGTGFLSTPFVLSTLTESGYLNEAYRMLENEKAPGWLHEVNEGATTVWEDWEGEASHNHYSPGAVCEWMFDTIAGIRILGENKFLIKPQPGGTLTWASAAYLSPYGLVSSRWKIEGSKIIFEVSIPSNTSAMIELPDGNVTEVCWGEYKFTC